jgi:O-antigen ligase
MVEAHPVIGVGAGNFQVVSIHYLLAPGPINFAQYIVDVPQVAHNAYLEVLSETGIVGLALFGGLIAGCIGAGVRATRNFSRSGDRGGHLLAVAVLAASASVLAGYFFLSDEHSKYLWLLLSLGPALLAISRQGTPAAGES